MHAALQGAKGASAPYEADDTLKSTQRAEIVDLLGEGQIGGLVNGLKSVYLDGVPVENADGSRNFAEFGLQLTLGGPTSEADHEFGDVQTEVGVGVTVLAAVPVVRAVTDPHVDGVRVTLNWPQLLEVRDNGDRVGTTVEYQIHAQSNGGGYVLRWGHVLTGKASSPYSRAVWIPLRDLGPAPWDIRVSRVTADSTSMDVVNAFSWASYTVISGVRLRYRNSAVARLTFDARNFSAIPSRWYDVMGVSDWDIPVNYDPRARAVVGAWSGLWKQDWTNNPAWVLYNLIKHPRYGLGQYVTQLPDKWTLYQLALWCDESVPDGRGGTEPRYTINAVITEQHEALRLLGEICSVFRGVLMYGGSTLTVTWDAPGQPVASYAPANVVDGLFTYADGSSAAKKTSCTCWYTDRSQAAKRMPVTWDDPELVAAYGLRTMEINPIGVSTPGQALRMAKWALYTSHYEEQTVSFRVGAEGPIRRLGEVFQITDPSETGERLGGRIRGATLATVTLDAAVTLMAGETYTLWVSQPHPTDPARLVLESRTVTTAPGVVSMLNVTPTFSTEPLAQTVWLLEGSNVAPTLWRYVAINEVKGEDGRPEYEVMGVRHEPGKWALIEADQPLTPRPTRRISSVVSKPTALSVAEVVYLDGPVQRIRATVSWQPPAAGLRYLVAWRLSQGPWLVLPLTTANTVDIDALQPGLFEVMVRAQNGLGITSLAAEASLLLTGLGSPPPNVSGLAATEVATGVKVSWNPYAASNAGETELRQGASWETGTLLWRGRASSHTLVSPAAGTYTIWAKHRDLTGQLQSPDAQDITFIWSGTDLLSALSLVASSLFFKVATDGSGDPASITLTAQGQNLAGAPVFTIVSGTAALGGSGTSRTLAYSSMTTDSLMVQVTWDGMIDEVSIFKLRDGTDGLTWLLTNEAQAVACDSAGNVLPAQLPLTAQMVVARGATILTSGVTFGVGGVSGLSGVSIHASTGAIQVTGVTADTAYADFQATVGSTTLVRRLRVTKIRAGGRGASNHRIYIAGAYSTPPATPSPTSNGATPAGWSATPVTVGVGEAQWQSDGNTPEGSTVTTWSTPYLSYFKVGQLSAITADLGTITAGVVSGVTFNVALGGGLFFKTGLTDLAVMRAVSFGPGNNLIFEHKVLNGEFLFYTLGTSGYAFAGFSTSGTTTRLGFAAPSGGNAEVSCGSPLHLLGAPLRLRSYSGYAVQLGQFGGSTPIYAYNELTLHGVNNHLRLIPNADSNSGVGMIFRNDGSSFYMLLTASGGALGGWNSLRPFSIDLASGKTTIGNVALRDVSLPFSGGGTAAFNAAKPGSSNSNYWLQIEINGGTWLIPAWPY